MKKNRKRRKPNRVPECILRKRQKHASSNYQIHILPNGEMINEQKIMEEEAKNPGYLHALIEALDETTEKVNSL